MHKIIYSDLKLYHSNIRNSSLCTFCSKDIGDFIHNYWSCYEVQAFIANAMQWYNQSMNSNLKLDIKIYLLGSHNLNRRLDIFTEFFYWVLKWFIHCCRHGKNLPTLYKFKNFLKMIHDDEKYYALKYDNFNQHNRKWLIPAQRFGF